MEMTDWVKRYFTLPGGERVEIETFAIIDSATATFNSKSLYDAMQAMIDAPPPRYLTREEQTYLWEHRFDPIPLCPEPKQAVFNYTYAKPGLPYYRTLGFQSKHKRGRKR